MQKLLVVVVVALAGGLLLPGGALGFHQPADRKKGLDVPKSDRPYYNIGRTCVKDVKRAFKLLTKASRQGKFNVYVAGARSVKNKAAACVGKVKNGKVGTKKGAQSRAKLVKAMKQYRQAGLSFKRSADAQVAGDADEVEVQTKKAGRQRTRADRLLKEAEDLARCKEKDKQAA